MLSRRQFLQAAKIALAAAHLPPLYLTRAVSTVHSFEPLYGRALSTVPVYAAPQTSAALLTTLWSDTVVPILSTSGAWYRLPDGYVQRELLQPMLSPAQTVHSENTPPFWGEVTGAVAIIRTWCAANAPIVSRVGHGGVLYVADRLPLDGVNWYGVASSESGDLLGWSQAASWTAAPVDQMTPNINLIIDRQAQQLTAFDPEQPILTAPIAARQMLVSGAYAVTGRGFTIPQALEHPGTPWALTFGANQHLSGAYWHNRFGSAPAETDTGGAAIEVAPALARWLYPRVSSVIIS